MFNDLFFILPASWGGGGGVWEGYSNQSSILQRELGNAIEPLGSWPCV